MQFFRYPSAWRCGQAVQGELGMMGEQSQISDSAFSGAADSSLKAYTVIRSLWGWLIMLWFGLWHFLKSTLEQVCVCVCVAVVVVVVFDLVISVHFTNILIQKCWIIEIFWNTFLSLLCTYTTLRCFFVVFFPKLNTIINTKLCHETLDSPG